MTHFHTTKGDADALRLAFSKCGQLANAGNHAHVTIAVSTKTQLQGILDEVLTEDAAKALARNNLFKISPTLTVHLATERIPVRFAGPVLAAWVNMDHMATIEQSGYATDIVYVPWASEELAGFKTLFTDAEQVIDPPPAQADR
jgi:hypothetical protein